ncbi:MAG: phosphodiester glycosidase family protein [Synergistaceae bacterium]|nr:phosphodiester glycosidase family protein [Synergistaceae bacterium]
MKKLRHTYILLILLLLCSQSEAVTKYAFLSGLLNARGIDWSSSPEAEYDDPGGFMLRTGYITDDITNLDSPVTRREALRWCIQSLGLAFEADLLSDYPSGFTDANTLSGFERGCLVVASNMNPQLFDKTGTFSGKSALSNQDYNSLMSRVMQASSHLTLDMIRNPLDGIRVFIHREGVPSGIPSWRVYAYGMNRETANNVRNLLKSQGIESSLTGGGSNSGVRTAKLEDFNEARRFIAFLNFRKIRYRLIPIVSNPKTRIVPRFWVMAAIDPSYWKILPVASGSGPNTLSPLSRIVAHSGAGAAINAGFFAVLKGGKGYPIGALKVAGRDFGQLYEGRGGLGWNDDDEALFGVPTEEDYSVYEMNNVIQAGPLLLDGGIPAHSEEDFPSAFTSARHPRSAVGINSSGQWVFMIVDGRNGMHSSGATISELTEILRGQQVTYALNLDGGGSTELIVDGRIYNSPSDGYERNISYALGAIAR